MSSLSAIALSGMNAAQSALDVAGHNVANLATAGFRRQEAVNGDLAGGGVGTTVRRSPVPGESLVDDVVGQLQAKNSFIANLAVFRTGDRMMGSLLDAVG